MFDAVALIRLRDLNEQTYLKLIISCLTFSSWLVITKRRQKQLDVFRQAKGSTHLGWLG